MNKKQREIHRKRVHRTKKSVPNKGRVALRILALFVVCALPFLFLKTAAASKEEPLINVEVASGEILEGEQLPETAVKVTSAGDLNGVLDKETKETAEDILHLLQSQKGYTVKCEADTQKEGEYPITIQLDERMQKALDRAWIGLVNIELKDGVLKVKNPIGNWEQDKFLRYDGTYVENDFVVSRGDTYYFGVDGVKVSGWQDISDGRYYFAEDGKMQKGWLELDGANYYLAEDGKMQKGWLELDGARYYLSEEGKKLTGEQKIGIMTCVFDENGVLISEKVGNVDPSKPMVALTFDDGPGPRTGELLAALEQHSAKATFFMLGQKITSHAAEVQKMKDIGCELGNHSYDHADLSKLGADGVQNEVGTTNQKISEVVGTGATVMRPPYGAISQAVKDGVGMPMILWNIDTLDWKTRNAQKTIDSVMSTVKDGDVILMHDIHSESVDAAIQLIPMLQQAGYQLVTVSEMASAKGQVLENGRAYTDF